ncbi:MULTISPECIES: glycosyltransferase [Clostridium]|uniref:Glycosyltransferase n=1 Tax=Clostridium aquiflavi TaxID=3073603 RepID=A0ABU1EGD9_9CLOT|nr:MULTISPECIES: glycosyltransferase [unclassified Clostridium]MDR5587228.1 glycosyltransferase [Clostridium sp. 5N-1]NFG61904.1 glycosyltransferase [Clostridium botulinum]NFQ08428.1 glycosyltransferase [Clostridium botulinum]
MKGILRNLLLSSFLLTLILVPVKSQASEKGIPCNKATCDLRMSEQILWIDHVSWTKSFITSDLSSLEDKKTVLERLLKNQDDIGNSIKPYYGEAAGNKLSVLLREHIELAGQVTDAAKSENKDDLEKYNKLWYENADKISDFLSSANPNYSNKVLKDMLYKHLQFVTDQVVASLNKDWKSDIESYDKGEKHMIMFADILTDGIIKQFPQKFK